MDADAPAAVDAYELERRYDDGERVRLLWLPELGQVITELLDLDSGEIEIYAVPEGRAAEAYAEPLRFAQLLPDYDYRVRGGEIERRLLEDP